MELCKADRPWTCWKLFRDELAMRISIMQRSADSLVSLLEGSEVLDAVKSGPAEEDRDTDGSKGSILPELVRNQCWLPAPDLIVHPQGEDR